MNKLSRVLIVYSVIISLITGGLIFNNVRLNNSCNELQSVNNELQSNNEKLDKDNKESNNVNESLEKENEKLNKKIESLMNNKDKDELITSLENELNNSQKELNELKEENNKLKEQVVELSPQEQARNELVKKHGKDVVEAWEKLSRDSFFNYLGYKLIIEENNYEGKIYYTCYKEMEDGTKKDAYVGGEYYIYSVYMSNEAFFDLVEYHNNFFTTIE